MSIYLYSGDFARAWESFLTNGPQAYGTHDALMRTVAGLVDSGVTLRLVSLNGDPCCSARPVEGLEIVGMGVHGFDAHGALARDVANSEADFLVAFFPNDELLQAAIGSSARVMAVLADSFNQRSVGARWRRRQLVKLLNHQRIEWVSNHCEPATVHLADLGVHRDKLIPWNSVLPAAPFGRAPTSLDDATPRRIFYAGSLNEDKGVSDLICAIALLRDGGIDVVAELAGSGDLELMRGIARHAGVEDYVTFPGCLANDDIRDKMSQAHLVVVPSRAEYPEGMPLTLFEALASRTPIVCSDHPMFVGNFIDGTSASTFRAGDVPSLAAAIERTLGDADLYHRLSANAECTWASLGNTADIGDILRAWAVDDDQEWLRSQTLAVRR